MIIGFGFNGFVVGVLFVCVGYDVCVFEVVDMIGGGVCIVEFIFFGFWYDVCFIVYLVVLFLLFFCVLGFVECIEWIILEILYVYLFDVGGVVIVWCDVECIVVGLGVDQWVWFVLFCFFSWYIDGVIDFIGNQLFCIFWEFVIVVCYVLWMLDQGILFVVCSFWIVKVVVLILGVVVYVNFLQFLFVGVVVGFLLVVYGYVGGWLFFCGGVQWIVDVLVVDFEVYGGFVEFGMFVIDLVVFDWGDFGCGDLFLLNIFLCFVFMYLDILFGYGCVFVLYCYGVVVVKVDFVFDGLILWMDVDVWQVVIVYFGGICVEIWVSENVVVLGCVSECFYVFVVQLIVFDLLCVFEGKFVLWVYIYVFNGFDFDLIEFIMVQVECFVFGFCDFILVYYVVFVFFCEVINFVEIGGDIFGGVFDMWQVLWWFILFFVFWCILMCGVYLVFVVILFGLVVYGMVGWYVVCMVFVDVGELVMFDDLFV